MNASTTRTAPLPPSRALACGHPAARRRGRPALASALVCAGAMCCASPLTCAGAAAGTPRETRARGAHPPRAASAPRTDAAALGAPPSPGQYAPPPPAEAAVYRCGNSYSARPCDASAPLHVDDARSASEHRQAQDVAARDKRLAAWLEAQRRERDAPASAPKRSPLAAAAAKPCVPTRIAACPVPKKTPSAASKAKFKTGAGAILPPSG